MQEIDQQQTKVVFFCLPGIDSFLRNIEGKLSSSYETRMRIADQDITHYIQDTNWADIIWIEWANELAVALTKNFPFTTWGGAKKQIIIRLHSYEALHGYLPEINWEPVTDIICVAPHVWKVAMEQIPIKDLNNINIHIIPNGVDLDKFEFKNRQRGARLACLGNINHKKGPMLLLHAFHKLWTISRQYHLHVGGLFQEKRFEYYMKDIVYILKMKDNVHFEGWIEKPEEWLDDKNYIICSSPWEGHPVGVMEAMAMGIKPVIHSFYGANALYPENWIWDSIPEFVRRIKETSYNSKSYRNYLTKKSWTLDHQMVAIRKVLNTAGESFQAEMPSTPEDDNMGEKIAEPRIDEAQSTPDDGAIPSPGTNNLSEIHKDMALKWLRKISVITTIKRTEDDTVRSPVEEKEVSCVPVHPGGPCYPEVTGYFIPTLHALGEIDWANQYAEWLLAIQNEDGSFHGPKTGTGIVFDTGQVIKGWLSLLEKSPGLEDAIRKAVDWIIETSDENGRLMVPDDRSWEGPRGKISEFVHYYVLSGIWQAANKLEINKYSDFVIKSLDKAYGYSDGATGVALDFRNSNQLSHFFFYIIEAMIDLGPSLEFVALPRQIMERMEKYIVDNNVPAYHDVRWICSPGQAQAALCYAKLGEMDKAKKLLSHLEMLQNSSGGWFGSYGLGAEYFQDKEVSWTVKFYLDAWILINQGFDGNQIRSVNNQTLNEPHPQLMNNQEIIENQIEHVGQKELSDKEWHEALSPNIKDIHLRITSGKTEVAIPWFNKIKENIGKDESSLELGSGTGEMSIRLAVLGREVALLDKSKENIQKSMDIFSRLRVRTDSLFFTYDVTKKISINSESYDTVWSSGLLEHFEDPDIQHIINESTRIARKKVMALVPNSKCGPYAVGKKIHQEKGTWKWGKERDFNSLKPYFEKAGLINIQETTVAPSHALRFLPPHMVPDYKDNQEGYLLVAIGQKKKA